MVVDIDFSHTTPILWQSNIIAGSGCVLRESKIRQGGVAGQCGDYAADAGVGQITDVETAVRSYSNADRSV